MEYRTIFRPFNLSREDFLMIQRFTSRKFLLAVGAGITAVLVATDVISAGEEVQITTVIIPALYILVEGIRDIKNTKRGAK